MKSMMRIKMEKLGKMDVWCSLPLLPSPILDGHLCCALLSPLVQTWLWGRGGGGGGVEVDAQLLRHISQLLPGQVAGGFCHSFQK